MEFKKKIVYFFTVKQQLHLPINKFMFNLRSKAIDLLEIKRQEVKKIAYDFNYSLFTSLVKRIRKLHFLLEDFDSFRFVFIDGINHYKRSLYKAYFDVYYERFITKEVAYLYFTEGEFVEKPIEILYVSTKPSTRNFIVLGKGSCVKIIEHHKTLNLGKDKFSSATEVYMNSSSILDYCKIRNDISTTYFLDQTWILQEKRSSCKIHTFLFPGVSIKNFLSIHQLGKEILSIINGISIFQEHIIYNTLIEHILPNGRSRDVYRGFSDKMAKTFYNGKIIVLKSAKKTNAIQNNTNILLANEAKVKANPQLEIFAEDVKCYHGCIVGQLNNQETFYLRSRGIPKSEAIRKLLFAYSKEILASLPFKRLKNLIKKDINKNVFFK